MDIDLSKNEQFFSFSDPFSHNSCQSNFTEFDRLPPNDLFENIGVFDWTNDRTLNCDTSLISAEMICSSPIDRNFPKVIWENLQNKIALGLDDFSASDETPNRDSLDLLNTSFTDLTNFDITQYVLGDSKEQQQAIKEIDADAGSAKGSESENRKIKAGVKKIDLKAQRYIIEDDAKGTCSDNEDDVDIETVSDNENSPVLEAGDLTSLLEQFEATEDISLNHITLDGDNVDTKSVQPEIEVSSKNKADISNNKVTQSKPEAENIKIFDNRIDSSRLNKNKEELKILPNQTNTNSIEKPPKYGSSVTSVVKSNKTKSSVSSSGRKQKVLEYLPQEVIDRIRESGKRKPITVIEPIANGRKAAKAQVVNNQIAAVTNTVQLDHNYCGTINYVSKKDSGFHSSDEDDRSFGNRHSTSRNDKKTAVSVLKANNVQNTESNHVKKKILNLEEYKKRRKHVFNSNSCSQTTSPMESSCNSPQPEDETQKMLRHQEKLRKMAQEVLIAAPKCVNPPAASPKNSTLDLPPLLLTGTAVEPSKDLEIVRTVEVKVPSNLERKVLVSFGVNTDFKMSKDENTLAPVEKLQEIKPLLEKVSDKINENSFINSLIENIPKIITKKEKESQPEAVVCQDETEHGENKQVLYLEKGRPKVETKDVETQTNISLIDQCKRGRNRKRDSSVSSTSSGRSNASSYKKRKRSSESSTSSRSSNSYTSFSPVRNSEAYSRRRKTSTASSTSSRSSSSSNTLSPVQSTTGYSRLSCDRSRSRSPRRRGKHQTISEREHLNAVEERRIIYVGRIKIGTTKEDLRRKFKKFGPITNISLHFRDQGENYGFVTFKYKEDAHEAYEHGNDDKSFPSYKISFGGRREFCKSLYSDLDNMRDDQHYQSQNSCNSFDQLLKEFQEKLKRRRV